MSVTIDKSQRTDHMAYMEGMEQIDPTIRREVIEARDGYDAAAFGAGDVRRALSASSRGPREFAALLSPAAAPFLEEMARLAREEKRRYFGDNVYLFTPLYISNYCENYCVYCGFNCHNKIRRAKLNMEEIENELKAIAETGLEEILILTGESRSASGVEYIGDACELASRYFKTVGIEVYPMNSDEYAYLHKRGVDYVTVFQETYDSDRYEELHLSGHKRVFPYRFEAQERALMGGMRGVAFAALLGLSDFRRDAFAVGMHAYLLQRKYPRAEISFSCPRLRPIVGGEGIQPADKVGERELLQILCAYRLFMPYAGITVSTRERAGFRDNVMDIAATKISAGVSTGIGGHTGEEKGDDQFEIADNRTVDEVTAAARERALSAVTNDYIYL